MDSKNIQAGMYYMWAHTMYVQFHIDNHSLYDVHIIKWQLK